ARPIIEPDGNGFLGDISGSDFEGPKEDGPEFHSAEWWDLFLGCGKNRNGQEEEQSHEHALQKWNV
ncbi:MAG TPA: hypothetical protein VMZ27_14760, partial [Candidatus Saccharimonadales bacterium]|nr:hypothetical protein [Candidatus Saccharimonadales bacterium]